MYHGARDFDNELRLKIQDAYSLVESFFQSNEKYLVGNEMTIADISCGCTLVKFDQIESIDMWKFPKLYFWLNSLLANETFYELNSILWTKFKKLLPMKYSYCKIVKGTKIFW